MTTNSDNSGDNKDDNAFAKLESLAGNFGAGAFAQYDNVAQNGSTQQSGGNGLSRPDVAAAIMTIGVPTDPYLNGTTNSQWYLIGAWGIHADKAWPDYTGTGIVIADLDDGFQTNHPDLAANFNTALSYNFVTNTSNVTPMDSTDNHGTAVMGVMIAAANGVGTVGAAYTAQGVGIVQGFGTNGLDQTLSGFQYALTVGVDVMNNSWGYTDSYADDFGKTFSGTSFLQVGAAMKTLVDHGRGGLGTDIVFSAGNSRTSGDNTNYHNFQNSPYAITVAAIDSPATSPASVRLGTSILVSAGGVDDLMTIRTGTAGYASGDYGYDSGTSFSAPTVSGLIALMLQANPNLGWRDVQEILAYSAQHNDPTSAGWQYNGTGNWNGGGLHYSSDYGFGAADAFTAVRLTETWNLHQTSANMTTFSTATSSPHMTIPDMGTITTSINVTQNINIEHVLINLDISHTFAGDLVVTLIAPDGTQSVLVNNPGNDTFTGIYGVAGIQFQASTLADWGESSAGTWTLKVQDNAHLDFGTLNSWGLTFMGSAPTADNTYVYTNDFGTFSGVALSARNTLSDTNGGTDTINLSAVSSDTNLNMNGGTASTVAGSTLNIAAGTIIENAYLGDGNDTITGNTADNHIYGGRGNDTVIVGVGNDTLDGGVGTDKVSYLETIADFTFNFVNATTVDITHAVGAAWTDIVTSFENFMFSDGTYTMAGLEAYVSNGSIPPPSVTPPPPPVIPPPVDPTIHGGPGNDVLTGTTSADTMAGGLGNDTYVVNNTGDVVIENPGEGTDLVQSSIAYQLTDNVENLTLTGTAAINGAGNALNNVITGNGGANVLNGGAGNDTITGGAGKDTITGGAGNDILYGSTGADKFVFAATTAANGMDTIKDFNTIAGDKLDLSLLLSAHHPSQNAIDRSVHATSVTDGTMISVDVTGSGIATHFVNVALLQGVHSANVDTLFSNGNLVD